MPGREIKKTLGSLFHGIISPSPYSENSSRRLRDFQEAVSSTRQSTSQKETDNNTNQSQDREITDALAAHNHARRSAPTACEVQRADLKWSRELTASAQRWANYLADHGKFKHDKKTHEGENLYLVQSRDYPEEPLARAVQDWVSEGRLYNGEKVAGRRGYGQWGHYTQVIWPSTTHVGMASARGAGGKQIIVARYSPCGNEFGRSAWGL